MPSDLTSQ